MRAFIAFEIPEFIRSKIEKIQHEIHVDKCIKLTKREQLHITLNFLGFIDEKKFDEIKKKMETIEIKKHYVEIKHVGFFPSIVRPTVLYVGVYDIKEVATKLFYYIKHGELVDKGHITIARIKCKPSKEFFDSVERLKEIYIGSFFIDKLTIFESILSKEGAIYKKIYEKSLQ